MIIRLIRGPVQSRLKGSFDNRSRQLWPGQFVNVVLTMGDLKDVVTVPSQAVQNGANGTYRLHDFPR